MYIAQNRLYFTCIDLCIYAVYRMFSVGLSQILYRYCMAVQTQTALQDSAACSLSELSVFITWKVLIAEKYIICDTFFLSCFVLW